MLKQILAGTAAVAAMGLATSAMAIHDTPGQNGPVEVNIQVLAEASMWPAHFHVDLVMDGQDGNNSATFESSIAHINNVSADIAVNVAGTLPTPQVSGGGINFFIFKDLDATDSVTAITGDAYNPAGALVWTNASVSGPGTELPFATVAAGPSIQNIPVTYASASPGELPAEADYDLTVTWTITPN